MKFNPVIFLLGLTCSAAVGQQPLPTPKPIREEVTVTANRVETSLANTPASVVVLSARDVEEAAAPTIDDVLRQSVGFSTFRRTGSRHANPTTQGVSLRGVGSSGASRTAVFYDGVPLNDPFGGWVQWNRVLPISVETIEVRRGGSSSLYGDAGLSGAINLKPRRAAEKYLFSADVFGGTQETVSGSVFTGARWNQWHADIAAGAFRTKGYIPIDEPLRGPADSNAGVRNANLSISIYRDMGQRGTLFFRPSYYSEERTNGTVLQTNQTHIRQAAAGGDVVLSRRRDARLVWRAHAGTQVYDQVFTAVNPARTSESLTRLQRVPAQIAGTSGHVSVVVRDHVLLAGAEFKGIRGASDEVAYAGGSPVALTGSGGREKIAGVFFQDIIKARDNLTIAASLRFDRWSHSSAFSATTPLVTRQTSAVVFPDRSDSAVSPHIAALLHLNDTVSLFAAASRSFRSPTLNELYRGFRVGNVQTLSNEFLTAEKAANFEAGTALTRQRATLRANVFWTSIDDPVANVTVGVTPQLITRQRQNAGTTRSRGLELEGEVRFRRVDLKAGYLFADSTVTSFPANPALVGLAIPQVARHQFTAQARYARAKWALTLQARGSGQQYDDDLNQFRLEPYAQLDVFASRDIGEKLKIYAAVENLFNSRYSTAKTPLRSISSPLNFRVGVRWN